MAKDVTKSPFSKKQQAELEKALESQHTEAQEQLQKLRQKHPDATPKQLISKLTKWYLAKVTALGAGSGAVAFVPNLVASLVASFLDLAAYMKLSARYVLMVATIHNHDVSDEQKRKLLVSTVLVGDVAASEIVAGVIDKNVTGWSAKAANLAAKGALKSTNNKLVRKLLTKWGTRKAALILGKQAPLLIGAAIGGVGNGLMGGFVVRSAREVFGEPPADWS